MLQETQKFAIASIMKQWETLLKSGLVLGSLKTNAQCKKALMNHIGPYVDKTFNKLTGRDAYNSFVGALTINGLVTEELVKEIYSQEEVEYMEDRGMNTDGIHIVEGLKPLKGF